MQCLNTGAAEIKLAQFPHNLFISGLFLFDLMLTPAVIVMNVGMAGMLIPLLLSGSLIAYIYLRSKRRTASWFVDAHWKLAYQRAVWLMAAYGVSALLILVAWLMAHLSADPNMQRILWTALTRIALMPTLILVLVTAVMEFSAYAQAGKCEVPDKLAAKFPPPADLSMSEC